MLVSCNYFKNIQLLTGAEIRRTNYVQKLPFEMRKDLIIVKARLNNDTVLSEFIFDTGAFNSKVEKSLADKHGFKVHAEKNNSTAQGISRNIEVVRIDSLQLGETMVYNLGAGKLEYGATSASQCIAGSGIIGANLMKLAHWKIDFKNQYIYFSDQPFPVSDRKYTLPFDRPTLSGTPKIDLTINNRKVGNIMFDVGYNGGLVLPLHVAELFESECEEIILDQATSGIYGTNVDSLIVKKIKVEVAGYEANIPVEFSALNKALLGNEFLKHFDVIINYDEDEIYLVNQTEVEIDMPKNFIPGILNDSLWVVNRTSTNLPFSLGDTLRFVNGKRPVELFQTFCDYILGLGQLYESESLEIVDMSNNTYQVLIDR
jgi:predicted aspartyl protease